MFKTNTHEPVAPIVTLVGFQVGVNVHVPLFDQVFIPGEFVDTTARRFLVSPAARDETCQVTFVGGAAETGPAIVTPTKTPTTSSTQDDLS